MDDDIDRSLSLYFSLAPGAKADLEVVAAATMHWVATLRAAAQEIEPGVDVRIELVDAIESSLILNTLLDWGERHLERIEKGVGKHKRVKKLAIATAIFVVTVGYPTYEFDFGGPQKTELSEEDRARLDELTRLIQNKPAVEESRRKFYRTLERDPAIKGVGVTEKPGEKPKHLVASRDFAALGGLWDLEVEESERSIYPVMEVVLISPALVAKPRAWRFKPEGLPEFSATMRDERFLAALEQDHVRERLRIGIPMTIRLKVDEQNIGGVWEMKKGGRSVVEVLSPPID